MGNVGPLGDGLANDVVHVVDYGVRGPKKQKTPVNGVFSNCISRMPDLSRPVFTFFWGVSSDPRPCKPWKAGCECVDCNRRHWRSASGVSPCMGTVHALGSVGG